MVGRIDSSCARAIQANVANQDDVERLIAQTIDHFGRLDIVVNNAARYAENRFDRDEYAWHEGLAPDVRAERSSTSLRARRFAVRPSSFLASPMADYLNGVTIDINGGSWFH